MLDFVLMLLVSGCSNAEIIKNCQAKAAKANKQIPKEKVGEFIIQAQKLIDDRCEIDVKRERAKALIRLEMAFKLATAKGEVKLAFDIQKDITKLLALEQPIGNRLFNK